MDMGSANWAVFKEPKAFIKILQLLLTIITFSLTSSFSSQSSFKTNCTTIVTAKYNYPFNIGEKNKYPEICGVKQTDDYVVVFGNYQSQSQFFVFVGVIVMLYSIAALILYIFFSDASYQDDRIPKADFIITAVMAALWFIASVAWADGVSKLKVYTDPNVMMKAATYCKTPNICTSPIHGTYGGLDASLVGGFGNFFIWVGNLWFVYKDTMWYERNRGAGGSEQMMGPESVDGGNM